MTMTLQLLVAAVAVGLSVAVAPLYKEHVQAMEKALETLERNVLSMEGNIPLLNDSRRHYAEIVHVVNYHGIRRSGCMKRDYYKEYYQFLNISAPEAINNPQLVLTKLKNLHLDVHNSIAELKELINACIHKSEVCNELIDDTVQMNPDQFSRPAYVLISAGEAATELNKLNEKIEEVSSKLKAHQFVSTSPADLKNIVDSVAQVHRSLNPYSREC